MGNDTSEILAKERLAASRRALLREMGVPTPISDANALPVADIQAAGIVDSPPRLKRPPLWQTLAGKAVERWWAHHPVVVAAQIVRPVLRPYARQHPGVLVIGSAAAGVALYVLRPWRLLSVTSLAILVLRGPALPRKALKWAQAAQQKAGLK